MWQLIEQPKQKRGKAEQAPVIERTYRNTRTESECKTQLIYTDKFNNRFWGFVDLLKIPEMRMAWAGKVTELFTAGITREELKETFKEMKRLLKESDTGEKYELCYSYLLQTEQKMNLTADPVKQRLSLCSVYVLNDNERIDQFNEEEAATKLQLWSMDVDAAGFFLNWLQQHIEAYTERYKHISETVLRLGEKMNH